MTNTINPQTSATAAVKPPPAAEPQAAESAAGRDPRGRFAAGNKGGPG